MNAYSSDDRFMAYMPLITPFPGRRILFSVLLMIINNIEINRGVERISTDPKAAKLKGHLSAGDRLKFISLARFHQYPPSEPSITFSTHAQIGRALNLSAPHISRILSKYLSEL